MELEQLRLAPYAMECARRLKHRFPNVVFTSGRRSLEDQARVMATNVMKNRNWIRETYKVGELLQPVVDRAPRNASRTQMEGLLLNQMLLLQDADVMKISAHLTGDAFDIRPMVDASDIPTAEGFDVIDFIRRDLQDSRLLLREGGLVIWHCQFPQSVEV